MYFTESRIVVLLQSWWKSITQKKKKGTHFKELQVDKLNKTLLVVCLSLYSCPLKLSFSKAFLFLLYSWGQSVGLAVTTVRKRALTAVLIRHLKVHANASMTQLHKWGDCTLETRKSLSAQWMREPGYNKKVEGEMEHKVCEDCPALLFHFNWHQKKNGQLLKRLSLIQRALSPALNTEEFKACRAN